MELSIGFYNGSVKVEFAKELKGYWKCSIDPCRKTLKKDADEIVKTLKRSKYFKSFSMGYSPIDYYSESYDTFEVPYVYCTSENIRTKVDCDHYNEIPKAWEKTVVLTLTEMNDIRLFNKFINALDIQLDTKQLNQVRESIRTQKGMTIEII